MVFRKTRVTVALTMLPLFDGNERGNGHKRNISLYLMVVLTVVSHDVFKGVKVRHLGLVSAEDFGSRTEVVGEVYSISLPHHTIPTQIVDLSMKRYVVGRPIPCR